ncbi:hypothetical protein F5Y15DRAFT_382041 [Xylariaceae sp. FL0016]|nr:hypothetical protein F5Y15DRAFT_382041 [Xylariaceae sp. FL0016]
MTGQSKCSLMWISKVPSHLPDLVHTAPHLSLACFGRTLLYCVLHPYSRSTILTLHEWCILSALSPPHRPSSEVGIIQSLSATAASRLSSINPLEYRHALQDLEREQDDSFFCSQSKAHKLRKKKIPVRIAIPSRDLTPPSPYKATLIPVGEGTGN